MESREFFRRARKLAAEIGKPFVVVSSKETSDGGRAGVLTYVSAQTAARLIVKDLAELATPQQTAAYFEADQQRRTLFEAEQMRHRIHVALANSFTADMVSGAMQSSTPAPAAPPQAAGPVSKSE